MATYFHGNPEIQAADDLQTLVLMNPAYVHYSNTPPPPPPSNNLVFLNSLSPNAPSSHSQQLVGIPLPAVTSGSNQDAISSLHGLVQRLHYNSYNPIDPSGAPRDTPRAQQGLSLTLSSQHQPGNYGSQPQAVSGGSASSGSAVTNGVSGIQSVLLSSKYLRAAQELLDEVVNVDNTGFTKTEMAKKGSGNDSNSSKATGELSAAEGDGSGGEDAVGKRRTELSTADRQEIQMKKAKLISMLDEGDKVRVVQTLLFVEGINTLLQTLFGTRLPTVIGGSYAFMVPIISIIHDTSLMSIEDNHRFLNTMRAVQGALIVASSIQIILGYSQMWAICSRFFSPLGIVPVIALVGFGLFDRGFPVVGRCVEIGIPMLILFIAFSQYLKNFLTKQLPILERFALLISITVIWAYAHLLTASGAYKHRPELTQLNCRTDKANLISSAPWIKIPYPLQWGAPTFDAGHAFGMMAAVLVSLIESTGAYKAASRLASATPPPAHVLSRGVGLQGIGILLNGLFGTLSGSTVSVEKVGLLGSTRVGSRRVIQISAGFMIFFSILGKFGALFASIPFTIFVSVYCVLFGLVASVGLSFLQFTNMNSMRNLFIVGVCNSAYN